MTVPAGTLAGCREGAPIIKWSGLTYWVTRPDRAAPMWQSSLRQGTQHAELRTKLLERAGRPAAGCAEHLPKDDRVKLEQRLSTLETIIAAEAEVIPGSA
jgi:hypothetical protein